MFSFSSGYGSDLAALHAATRTHLDQFVESEGDEWKAVLAMESDVSIWIDALQSFPESAQYRSAHRDLGLAFFALSTGLYRQAFAGLRSFIEVAFGALHLSTSELERRRWVAGRRDLSWSAIKSLESGIYSQTYLREFMPEAAPEAEPLLNGLVLAYRRSSEYLHGNVPTTDLLPTTIRYAAKPIEDWRVASRDALMAFHHSFFVRYYTDMPPSQKSPLESVLEQHLVHLRSVRQALQLPIEGA